MKFIYALLYLVLSAQLVFAEDRIYLFEDESFYGDEIILTGAGENSDLRTKDLRLNDNWNDEISSIYFDGDFKLTVYEDKDFQGRSETIRTSQLSLDNLLGRNWENRISSIRWEPIDDNAQPMAVFYEGINYTGKSFYIYAPGKVSRLIDKRRGSRNWNDQIRSVKIYGAYTSAVLYADARFRGRKLRVNDDIPNLGTLGFRAIASSVKVED